MTPFIDEAQRLLRMARRDYQTFSILLSHPEAEIAPIGFHAQQCVEKSLKAVITARQVYFRYTHDLEELCHLLSGAALHPPCATIDYQRLTPFAVELRYDEGIPLLTRDEADRITSKTLRWAEEVVASCSLASS